MSSRRGWRRRTRWSAWGRYGANTHRAVSSRGQWTETARSLSFRLGGRIPRRDRPRTPIPALPQGPDPFPAVRVRARGRHRLPHLFHLCARAGCPLGHVPVARPRPPRGGTRRASGGAATTNTAYAARRSYSSGAAAEWHWARRMTGFSPRAAFFA